ncbi:MAG: nitroreductase [Prevotellaceae bacterium]|nr:nitroreductase [Prevotellaceae bacterium]
MKSLKCLLWGAGLLLCASCGTQAQNEEAAEDQGNVVVETIMARRSVRQYTDQPVEREKLEQIAECGINAPSGMNAQPWQVRIVDNADYINGITDAFKAANPQMAEDASFKNMFRNATAVIFIASPADGSGQLDCGLLGENMILAAQSMGLGTCCLGGPIAFMKNDASAAPYVEKLALPEDYQLLYAIAVGYPDEAPEAKPRDAGKVRFVE